MTRANGDYYEGNYDYGKKSGRGVLKMGDAVYDG